MEWNVYYHDFNNQKIVTYNIFNHGSFYKELSQIKSSNKQELSNKIKRIMKYYL